MTTTCKELKEEFEVLSKNTEKLTHASSLLRLNGSLLDARVLLDETQVLKNSFEKKLWYADYPRYRNGEAILITASTESQQSLEGWFPCQKGLLFFLSTVDANNLDSYSFLRLNESASPLFVGNIIENWNMGPRGPLLEINHKIFLFSLRSKELSLLFDRAFEDWFAHPKGFVIQKGNKLLLNGNILLFEGTFESWKPHPDGVLICRDHALFVNGTHKVFEAPGRWDFDYHPDGFVIQNPKSGGRDMELLLNGTTLLYRGVKADWFSYPEGVVVRVSHERESAYTFFNQSQKAHIKKPASE